MGCTVNKGRKGWRPWKPGRLRCVEEWGGQATPGLTDTTAFSEAELRILRPRDHSGSSDYPAAIALIKRKGKGVLWVWTHRKRMETEAETHVLPDQEAQIPAPQDEISCQGLHFRRQALEGVLGHGCRKVCRPRKLMY